MPYVIMITAVVLALQLWVSRSPIAGLIIPMSSVMGFIMAVLAAAAPGGSGFGDPMNRLSMLLFLFIASASFLIYMIRRRQEYRKGYLDEDAAEDKQHTDNRP